MTALRILSTSDLGAATVPLPTSHGDAGTCDGIVERLEAERERQPTIWLDCGDLVVGHPSYPVLEERPWADVADLPIAAAAVGNHEFDDGMEAFRRAAGTVNFPLLCANVDVGLPPSAIVPTPAGGVGVIGLTHPGATSMVVADLGDDGAVVRGVERVPPVRPTRATAATEVLDAAAGHIVGELDDRWLIRTGAANYLPDLYAEAFRRATGADAGVAVPNFHGTQAPLDGAIGSLGPGPVTELDLLRPFAALDYDLTVAALRPGELQAAAATQWASADPRNTAADVLHWNWCRMPVGISDPTGRATTAAVIPAVVPCLSEWLGREVEAEPTTFSARDAVAALLSIH